MPRRPLLPVLAALVLAGCDKVESDFVLRLQPRTPVDERPFEGGPSVKLVLEDAAGSEILLLGSGQDGLEAAHLPPLSDAWLGLLLQDPPSTAPSYDPTALKAWGETGPFDLAKDPSVDASVLVADYAAIGDLDVLPDGTGAAGAALALTPGGDAWIFGGANALVPSSTLALSRQLRLEDLNGGDWRFRDAGTMPSVLGASARFEPTATLVDADAGPAILVVGGRPNGASMDGNLATAFLMDTATDDVVWSGPTPVGRSGHLALRLDNGRVLTVGGLEGEETGTEPAQASFEVFDPTWLAFDAGDQPLDEPARGLAIASLGPDGALVCGGSAPPADDTTVRMPSAACSRISVLGNVQDAADLPVATADLAMASLGDGRVLAVGGTVDPLDTEAVAATDAAWVYDVVSDTWTATGPLNHARARARALPTPDGRVVVIGGTETVGPGWYDNGAATQCVELYDPDAGALSEVECTGTGAGAWPVVASAPRGLAFVVSGWNADGTTGGGYGVVGLGPSGL